MHIHYCACVYLCSAASTPRAYAVLLQINPSQQLRVKRTGSFYTHNEQLLFIAAVAAARMINAFHKCARRSYI